MSYQEFLQDKLKDFGTPHGNHFYYWIPQDVFATLPIQMWKFNRPADKDRVEEIRMHLNESKRMDGVLYLACVDNELVCYESNHRREALKGVEGMANIVVDVLWDATDDQVKTEFLRLNKAISVPDLYFRPAVSHAGTLRELVDRFCKNFKDHKVNSNRPQRPNFTRDMVTDEFDRIVQEKGCMGEELETYVTELNRRLATRDRSDLPARVREKCEKTGLWLFAWSSKLDAYTD